MKKSRTILTPATESDFSRESKLVYWKQVLPQKRINYIDRKGKPASVDFTKSYLGTIIDHFKNRTMDQTPFLLADADNRHTMDPERFRADITDMRLAKEGEAPGVYAKFEFASPREAKAVLRNPKLGVSARIREEADGPKIIHVLGTLDPQVTGMSSWQPVDLSGYTDNVLDLSRETYTEGNAPVAKKNKSRSIDDYTEDEIDGMSEAEIDAFLAEFAPEFVESDSDEDDDDDEDEDDEDDLDDEDDDDDDEEDQADTRQLVGAGAGKGKDLSKKRSSRDIELANSVAAAANSRAQEALRRMADAEWKAYRRELLGMGVPPVALDLAAPVLNRPDDLVIDLSNSDSDDDDLNVAEVVRGLLDLTKGMIDTDVELGHSGVYNAGDEDPDAELLAAWDKQTPVK
jgi:hypothetical protein